MKRNFLYRQSTEEKLEQISLTCSQNIDQQKKLSWLTKGHNSVVNFLKLSRNNPNPDLVKVKNV